MVLKEGIIKESHREIIKICNCADTSYKLHKQKRMNVDKKLAEEAEPIYTVLTEEQAEELERLNMWQLSKHVRALLVLVFLNIALLLMLNNFAAVRSAVLASLAILAPTCVSTGLLLLIVKKRFSTLPKILMIQSIKLILILILLGYIFKIGNVNPYGLMLGLVLGLKLNWIVSFVLSIQLNSNTFKLKG